MGQAPSPAVEVHCKRELMHAVWNLLIDDEFIECSTNGLAVRCSDGVERVFFIRIITYSADYPEKQVLSISCGVLILIYHKSFASYDKKPRASSLSTVSNSKKKHKWRRYTIRHSTAEQAPHRQHSEASNRRPGAQAYVRERLANTE